MKRLITCLLVLAGVMAAAAAAQAIEGKIIDARTKAPIHAAVATLGDQAVRTDKEGAFRLEGTGETLKLRAAGYKKREIATAELGNPQKEIALEPFKVKGLYLTVYGVFSKKLRGAVLEAVKENNLNALVIDIKGDKGFSPLRWTSPWPRRSGPISRS